MSPAPRQARVHSPELSEPAERARRKVARRILPYVFLLYIIAYLDRANVAFANASMSADLGFSAAVFGFGAGIFFLGYFLLEIPGALIVERWSARRWLARIMVTWGLCTILVGLVRTPAQFYGARFLLGAAEAGFFPGVIVYLTHWFTEKDRARALAGFVTAGPVSLVIGAPLSALILRANWLNQPGWRWVFALEGIPAVILGFITLFYLTDRPGEAKWLEDDERQWLTSELERENQSKHAVEKTGWWRELRQRDVLLLTSAHFFANVAGYGFIIWLPSVLSRAHGFAPAIASALSALPFGAAIVGAWLSGRSSDRTGERKLHACLGFVAAGSFLVLSTMPNQPTITALGFTCLTGAAFYSWVPPFWVLPTQALTASAAAAAIGLINSVGNLGGFVGPSVTGLFFAWKLPPVAAMGLLSVCYGLAALLTFFVRTRRAR